MIIQLLSLGLNRVKSVQRPGAGSCCPQQCGVKRLSRISLSVLNTHASMYVENLHDSPSPGQTAHTLKHMQHTCVHNLQPRQHHR